MLLYNVDGNFTEGFVKNWVMNYQVRSVLFKKFEAFSEAVDFPVQVPSVSAGTLRRRNEPGKRYDLVWGMNQPFDVEYYVVFCLNQFAFSGTHGGGTSVGLDVVIDFKCV
jgi:hypothetical protein